MRRYVTALLLALVTALSATPALAQASRAPFRTATSPVAPPEEPQGITILDAPAQTTETELPIQGLVTPLLAFEPVQWENLTNSETGMVDVDQPTLTFAVTAVGGSGATTVLRDDITESASKPLTTHTPTPDLTGSWSTYLTTTSAYCEARSADYLQPSQVDSTGGKALICEAVPSAYPTGTQYAWSHRLATGFWSPSTSTNSALIFGITPTGYCSIDIYASTQNPDVIVTRVNAGVIQATPLSLNIAPAAGQVFKITRNGNNFELFRDDVSQGTFTDATCASTKRVGVGWGETRPGNSKLIGTGLRLDDFLFEDPAAVTSTGIPLMANVPNTIRFTACKIGGSPCYTKTISVVQGAVDSEDPQVSISVPAPPPIYGTDVASVNIGGGVSDNDAVASVGVTCATCTPTSRTTNVANGNYLTTSPFVMAAGNNDFIVTATDPTGNDATATIRIVLSAAADTTDPSITVTTANGVADSDGSSTSATSSASLAGTATDNVLPLPQGAVTWTSTACGSGTANGETSWTIPVIPLVPPGCTITVRVTDGAGRQSTDTHAFTYSAPLSIVTPSSLTAVEGANFSYCFAIGGGTAPYTVTKLTGTYPTGFALTGSSPTFCIGDSAVNVGTSGTYAGHSYRVTDSSGGPCPGTACADTSTFTITVGTGSLGGQNNQLYDSICNAGRTDVRNCVHLRSTASIASANGGNYTNTYSGKKTWAYAPATDDSIERQDMARAVFHAWVPTGRTVVTALSATPSGTSCGVGCWIDVVTFSPDVSKLGPGEVIKVDNEILTCVTLAGGSGDCRLTGASGTQAYMMRATYGTTLAAHAANTAYVEQPNSLTEQLHLVINGSATTSETVFYGIEGYFPATMGAMAAPATCAGVYNWPTSSSNLCAGQSGGYKGWQARTAGSITWEVKPTSNPGIASITPSSGFNATTGTDQGAMGYRNYTLSKGVDWLGADPVRPSATGTWNNFIFRTSEHFYLYWLIELNHDQNTAAFDTLTTLASPMTDTTGTTMVLDFSSLPSPPRSGDPTHATAIMPASNGGHGGRRARIGTEIMSVTSCADAEVNSTLTCTVVRNVDGSTPATHAAGDNVQVIWDYMSLGASSETQAFRWIYQRMPTTRRRKVGVLGALEDLNIEFNDSAARPIAHRYNIGMNTDMYMYMKNFFALAKPGTGGAGGTTIPAEWAGFLQQPTANGN